MHSVHIFSEEMELDEVLLPTVIEMTEKPIGSSVFF